METKTKTIKKAETERQIASPDNLLSEAVKQKLEPVSLKELVELKLKFIELENQKKFIADFTGFQSEVPKIEKRNVVKNKDGTVRYKYASFDDILTTITPLLKKYNFSISFSTENIEKNGNLYVRTTCFLIHETGIERKSDVEVPINRDDYMNDIQKIGSAITYSKLYALQNILGITTEEDTDTSEIEPTQQQQTQKQIQSQTQMTLRQMEYKNELIKRVHIILSNMKNAGMPDVEKNYRGHLKMVYNVETSKDLSIEQLKELCQFLAQQLYLYKQKQQQQEVEK
jgi:dUTPase